MTVRTGHPKALTPTSFHILLALADGSLHGYGIMGRLAEAGIAVGAGTVYGALSRMQESGWVEEGESERSRGPRGRRQRFALTAVGLAVLRADAARVVRAADLIREHAVLTPDPA